MLLGFNTFNLLYRGTNSPLVAPVQGEPPLRAAVGHHHLAPGGVAVEEQVVGGRLELQGGIGPRPVHPHHPPGSTAWDRLGPPTPRRVHRQHHRLPRARWRQLSLRQV